jgi:hypothetical protein
MHNLRIQRDGHSIVGDPRLLAILLVSAAIGVLSMVPQDLDCGDATPCTSTLDQQFHPFNSEAILAMHHLVEWQLFVYQRRYQTFGAQIEGTLWDSPNIQRTHFNVLLNIHPMLQPPTLLQVRILLLISTLCRALDANQFIAVTSKSFLI